MVRMMLMADTGTKIHLFTSAWNSNFSPEDSIASSWSAEKVFATSAFGISVENDDSETGERLSEWTSFTLWALHSKLKFWAAVKSRTSYLWSMPIKRRWVRRHLAGAWWCSCSEEVSEESLIRRWTKLLSQNTGKFGWRLREAQCQRLLIMSWLCNVDQFHAQFDKLYLLYKVPWFGF